MSAAPVDWRTRLRWLLTRYGIDTAHGWRMGIASLLLRQPNGTPPWRHWLARHFPHIRFDQPHPGDLLRIPLQLLWLALVRPARPAPVLRRGSRWYDPARWPAWLRPRLALPALAHGPAQAAMAQYGNRASTWITRFADLSLWQRAPVRYLVWGIAGVLALLCVTTPLDTVSQLVFATLIFALVFVIQSIQGPLATLLLTDAALNLLYYQVPPFAGYLLLNYLVYALLIGLGKRFGRKAPVFRLVLGGLAGAVVFYLVTNTLSWLQDAAYAKTVAGWIQALTAGRPDFHPTTWEMFRNTLLSGGLFTALFVAAGKLTAESPAEKNAGQRAPDKTGEAESEPEPEEAQA